MCDFSTCRVTSCNRKLQLSLRVIKLFHILEVGDSFIRNILFYSAMSLFLENQMKMSVCVEYSELNIWQRNVMTLMQNLLQNKQCKRLWWETLYHFIYIKNSSETLFVPITTLKAENTTVSHFKKGNNVGNCIFLQNYIYFQSVKSSLSFSHKCTIIQTKVVSYVEVTVMFLNFYVSRDLIFLSSSF